LLVSTFKILQLLGDFVPKPPTRAPPLDFAGDSRPPDPLWFCTPIPNKVAALCEVCDVICIITGSGTFRSPVFSLESSHWEHSLPGKKVPRDFRSRERKFSGTFQGVNVPGNICSTERYTGERTVRVTTSVYNA